MSDKIEKKELLKKINDFFENSEIKECPLTITGRERFSDSDMGIIGRIIMIFLGLMTLHLFFGDTRNGFLVGFGIFIFLCFLMYITIKIFDPETRDGYNKVKVWKTYFERKFDILSEFNPSKHNKLKIIHESAKTMDEVMFNIFMEGFRQNADAVIIHVSNSSTSVSQDKIRGVNSESYQHVSASLIKYK